VAEVAERREIVWRSVADLRPHPENPRTHSPEQIELLDGLIETYGWTNPLLIDEDGMILAGHGRKLTALKRGDAEVPTLTIEGLSPEEKWALVVADNQSALTAGWDEVILKAGLRALDAIDFDMTLLGFGEGLEALMADAPAAGQGGAGSLAEKFMVAPFSVLNAREGWWQERKQAWLALGIQSEVGRDGTLIGRSLPDRLSVLLNRHYSEVLVFIREQRARGLDDAAIEQEALKVAGERSGKMLGMHTQHGPTVSQNADGSLNYGAPTGTSIFDPVLCEIAYRWFSPPAGQVLDPFAGGSVRGIVAARLGRHYLGIDLSGRQLEANRAQAISILGEDAPRACWIEGDSRRAVELVGKGPEPLADMIFSCPPYADLEVYSDHPDDLSTMPYAEFRRAYSECIRAACSLLRPDRFACFVVGEVRDRRGMYVDFVGDTVQAFRDAGLEFYNEAILITAAGSLPIRAGKQFSASRKLGKTHQNVLVFLKGDAKRAVAACGTVEVDEALLDAARDPAEPEPEAGDDERYGERL
jgi:SAM-dependent methyltransferase